MNKRNPLNAIDFYKADHRRQYPFGTTRVYSNFTARSDKHAKSKLLPKYSDGKVIFFGLQYFIMDFLIQEWNEGFFDQPQDEVIRKYKRRMDNSLGVDAIPVDHIRALHTLGYLPIQIKALKEGTAVPIKTPMLTITNTLSEFYWLVNYLESVMSAYLWKACTSATIANQYKRLLLDYAEKTGGDKIFVQFQAHDFSFRGMSGLEDATISGAAHLLHFWGTDTVPAIDFHENYYYADADAEPIGFSVPATEHSVMCMGSKECEAETFKRLLTELYPKGIVSVVSDTWDFWQVLTMHLPAMKDLIMARDGKLVIRPDSGDPVDIICGTAYALSNEVEADQPHLEKIRKQGFKYMQHKGQFFELSSQAAGWIEVEHIATPVEPTPEMRGAVEILHEVFGGTLTEKGYKLLDSHIGLIYGDSITLERCERICRGLAAKGFASTNVVFGVGSFTYQYNTRDTFGFAVKSTYGEVNGEAREIFKDPKTDDGIKKSLKGLIRVNEDLTVQDQQTIEGEEKGLLETVFLNGELVKQNTLSGIRNIIDEAIATK